MREALRRHNTQLYVVSPRGAAIAGGNVSLAVGGDQMAAACGQYANSELASRGLELNLVLNDGAEESGGRHETVVANTLVETMERMARRELTPTCRWRDIPSRAIRARAAACAR